jgi:hypothetical protein
VPTQRKAAIELLRRRRLLDSLFPVQRAAVDNPAKKKLLWTTRRAGKTTTVLVDFCHRAISRPNSRFAYIALTQSSAEDIAWPILNQLNLKFTLQMHPQEHKLRMRFPNGSAIKLYGADRPGWMSRLYGQKLGGVAVDEAAFFSSVSMVDLIEDYLEPATIDLGGVIYLMSIPGHFPRGLFYHVTKQFGITLDNWDELISFGVPKSLKECPHASEWSVHRWTTKDNLAMAEKFEERSAQKLEENPTLLSDPSFIRNYRGVWYTDIGELVYSWDWERNTANDWKRSKTARFVLGIDFGWDDHTAFSVCSWCAESPDLVEVESHSEAEMRMDKIASFVKHYCEVYPGLLIVGDPAHKQFFEEFRRRYHLPIVEATKPEKYGWIQTINTDLRAGRIKVVDPEKSPHVREMTRLPWLEKRDGRLVEQPGVTNDCCDAFMMAYRLAYHYRYKPEKPKVVPGSSEHYKQIEDEMEKALEEQHKGFNDEDEAWYE